MISRETLSIDRRATTSLSSALSGSTRSNGYAICSLPPLMTFTVLFTRWIGASKSGWWIDSRMRNASPVSWANIACRAATEMGMAGLQHRDRVGRTLIQ